MLYDETFNQSLNYEAKKCYFNLDLEYESIKKSIVHKMQLYSKQKNIHAYLAERQMTERFSTET